VQEREPAKRVNGTKSLLLLSLSLAHFFHALSEAS